MRQQIEQTFNDAMDTIVYRPVAEMSAIQKAFNKAFSLAIIFAVIMGAATLAFHFLEGKDLTDSLWWATVTATSVGYGDMYPTTPVAKFIAGVFMLVCMYLLGPLITAKMSAQMIVDSDAFTHAEQEEIKVRQLKGLEQQAQIIKMLTEMQERLDKIEGKQDA